MFGERLKKLRIQKGLSQEELGKRLGVSKQTVSNWEIENVTPSLDMFENVVRLFDTTPNYLLGYEVYAGLDVNGLDEKEVEHIAEIIADYKRLHKNAE